MLTTCCTSDTTTSVWCLIILRSKSHWQVYQINRQKKVTARQCRCGCMYHVKCSSATEASIMSHVIDKLIADIGFHTHTAAAPPPHPMPACHFLCFCSPEFMQSALWHWHVCLCKQLAYQIRNSVIDCCRCSLLWYCPSVQTNVPTNTQYGYCSNPNKYPT